jgi:hypothetical protein
LNGKKRTSELAYLLREKKHLTSKKKKVGEEIFIKYHRFDTPGQTPQPMVRPRNQSC